MTSNESKTELADTSAFVHVRNHDPEQQYQAALKAMESVNVWYALKKAADMFFDLGDYKDAAALGRQCQEMAEIAQKDSILAAGTAKMTGEILSNYEAALELFEMVSGWKNADEQAEACRRKIEEINCKAEEARLVREEQAELANRLYNQKKKRTKRLVCFLAITAAVAVLGLIAGTMIRDRVIIPGGKYNEAVSLLDQGQTEAAYGILQEIGDYRDAAEKAGSIRLERAKAALQDAQVGDYITFGAYEQDNNTENGKEEIEWLILDRRDGKTLLISKIGLDCKPYNKKQTDVTWESSTIRKWLNTKFLEQAFSETEQAVIPTVTLSDQLNPEHGTDPGAATQDKVFLLSSAEAEQYFGSAEERLAQRSKYAKTFHPFVRKDEQYCWWWLRSPGEGQDRAASVYVDGKIFLSGANVNRDYLVVRPAVWIEPDA